MPAFEAEVGMPYWIDLTTSEPRKSVNFYEQVLGWEVDSTNEYRVGRVQGLPIAGFIPQPEQASMPDTWVTYFLSKDIDGDCARAEQLGGRVLVPELVKGQIEGGTAMGLGHALLEEMPLHEGGPAEGDWNFNRYRLPRAKDVAVWQQTSEILPPLSPSDPSKGIAEVVMIPIAGAVGNAIAHAIGKRVRDLPITPARIKEALNG